MLTEAQMQTLATAIRAESDPTVVAALAASDMGALANWYNADSTFIVWKSSVDVTDYREALVWTEVDQLTAGAARIFTWLTANMTLPFDASKANVRQGLADAFGPATTSRANLIAVSKRAARRGEALFATGTGTDGNPGTLTFEGALSYLDIGQALNRY